MVLKLKKLPNANVTKVIRKIAQIKKRMLRKLQATLSFDCENCDFNSNSENGLSIQMSKKSLSRLIAITHWQMIQIHVLRMTLKSI